MVKTVTTAMDLHLKAADAIEAIANARTRDGWEELPVATTIKVRVVDVELDQTVLVFTLPQDRVR